MVRDLGDAARKREPKFRRKAERVLQEAESQISQFVAGNRLNWYQRSRAANEFLWVLKDHQCDHDYAQELTQWLMLRLQR